MALRENRTWTVTEFSRCTNASLLLVTSGWESCLKVGATEMGTIARVWKSFLTAFRDAFVLQISPPYYGVFFVVAGFSHRRPDTDVSAAASYFYSSLPGA